MIRLSLLLPLALLGGCIIYDTHGKCPGCEGDEDGWWDTGRPGGDTDTDGETDTAGDTDGSTFGFVVTPSQLEIGSTVIASLTAAGGFDFSTIEGIEVYGEVDVLAMDARADELLLTLAVPATAVAGTADLLVLLPEDRVEFLGDALTLVAAGTGDDPTDPDGTDDGSGGTDTDDGSSDTGGSGSCP
ncbi:MAG: hypothetical protein Q8P41_05045 [Pseudomonadota bacterium]|nr:hypothetical protein [Pseudomonadota bacterium]